jgi:PPOX class probable F420-dependent enzyme
MAKHSMRTTTVPESHLDLLEAKCSGIACTLREDGQLSAHPVSFLWDGEHLRFSTLEERKKVQNLRADPRISLCIMDPENELRYLEIRGKAGLEKDLDRSFVNSIARKYMNMDEYPYDRPGANRVTVTIAIEQVSTPLMGPVK